ncbi:MAG: radical SAM protein [Theionarchaea archaeon]|nr:radical SAM protein [Theionarchaea archaeon]
MRSTVITHPCFDEKAHFTYGRIHLPVAEHCNIQCRYCSRDIGVSYHSYRPAVTTKVISPEKAVEQVLHCNDHIRVVGIAGPGEPLCNENTFKTLELVHDTFPDLILCVATNGLLLHETCKILVNLGVRTVTVTLNTVDPEKIPRIYSHIQGKMDEIVAKSFIQKQLEGIEACANNGILVKVNSILIPEITMNELEEVAVQSSERGAILQNITPLIPLAEFSGLRPPSCEEIQVIRNKCEIILPQFRLCKQCRADAVGIPGKSR